MNTLKIVQSLTAPHNTNVLWLNSANNNIYGYTNKGWKVLIASTGIVEIPLEMNIIDNTISITSEVIKEVINNYFETLKYFSNVDFKVTASDGERVYNMIILYTIHTENTIKLGVYSPAINLDNSEVNMNGFEGIITINTLDNTISVEPSYPILG